MAADLADPRRVRATSRPRASTKAALRLCIRRRACIGPDVAAEGSGFGGAASAWWQSHRGSFSCDGKRQVAWFTVDTVEPGSRGELDAGWAWVQFCITTDEDLSAVRMEWSRVVTN